MTSLESPYSLSTEHSLRYAWDIWFSHRVSGGAKDKKDKTNKEKESREEWEGGVVRIGGFSSIETMHAMLAHLARPSQLPASNQPKESDEETPQNIISDINIFRSSVAPLWEDPANTGGGRWVLRLRKGVADRIWEEVILALVGDRIGGTIWRNGDKTDLGDKINGVVMSVRRDEDILSLWLAPSNRIERDVVRDSLRQVLTPLLGENALATLSLDYKPHPIANANGTNGPGNVGTQPHHHHHNSQNHHRNPRGDRAALRSGPNAAGFPNYSRRHDATGPGREGAPTATARDTPEKYAPPFSRRTLKQ